MRTLTTLGVVLASLLLLSITPESANAKIDKRALGQAWGEAENLLKRNPDAVDDTVTAIEKLEGLLDYDRATELLKYYDECDRAWDAQEGDKDAPKEAANRPPEAYKIANAILAAVRKMEEGEEIAKFEEDINNREDFSLRPRMAMLDAVAAAAGDNEDCKRILVELAKNEGNSKDTDMRILALHFLRDYAADPEIFGILQVTLRDRSWRIRDVSIAAMIVASDHWEGQAILALINALAVETGKLRKTIADALKKITGADEGTDSDAWSEWWRNKKREDKGLPPKKKDPDRGTRVKVFETESFSDRYVFVLDTSISMTEKISEEEKERLKKSITKGPGEEDDEDKRRPLDWSKINCKLDLAREEIIRSLEVMDPERTMFTIISFAEKITVWEEELVPTDEKTIKKAADWMRAIKGKKKTNVFGALDAAYDLSERIAGAEVDKRKGKKKKKKKDDGKVITGEPHQDDALPDTIFLYSDGFATWGKYSGDDIGWQSKSPQEKATLYAAIMKDMVQEVEDRNRIARITLHCIGVGEPQDAHTMRKLSRACDGDYVAIGKGK